MEQLKTFTLQKKWALIPKQYVIWLLFVNDILKGSIINIKLICYSDKKYPQNLKKGYIKKEDKS